MPILQWLTREKDLRAAGRAPYRLLEEVERYGDGSPQNMLIQGDNLETLKALLPYYAGRMKCIYIDPPYNTKSAFAHYDDNLEHTRWLSMMYHRLELLREFLSEDGSIWVSIDDNEGHYLKVIMDEVFGRKNFLADVSWQRTYSTRNDAKGIVTEVEHVLSYAKNEGWMPNKLPRTAEMDAKYKNPDNDVAPWRSSDAFAPGAVTHQGMVYAVQHPFTGKMIYPTQGRCWTFGQDDILQIMNGWCPYKLENLHDAKERAAVCGIAEDAVRPGVMGIVLAEPLEVASVKAKAVYERGQWPYFYFTSKGRGGIARKTYLEKVGGRLPTNFWPYVETGHTDEAKKEILALFGNDVFATPKPERLIQRILYIATNPGDLVLDSFLGSGTTAAVAHKMGRRYIGIEMGEHAVTHCVPRLQKVVDGEQGGISQAVNWQGGGGFRFYKLGESIFDEDGAIREQITFAQLAAHVWFCETGEPLSGRADSPLLGVHEGTACYLLYNGILGDKKPQGGNVLTRRVLESLPPWDGPKVLYGERNMLSPQRMKELDMVFKQTPYDIKGR
ncbi:site-specific DNA-methyltransferase [uncultured Desulfovibrio sp.]|uniref:site-specific DNA-methyltransferase n=1 Tax=uncultured Desulfovibrio sp. TaxID=167968 RepID=UPI0026246B8F|nr:site-specific DNA-methyltransferase [uncultured Desulfovibrio sp.]